MQRSSYTYLSDQTVTADSVPFHGQTLRTKAGFFAILLLKEPVRPSDLLFQLVQDLQLDAELKTAALRKLTSGTLKIALELGKYSDPWKANLHVVSDWICAETGMVNALPDFVLLSHNHWTNYLGGIEYLQNTHPEIPIFLPRDMGTSLACFDFDPESDTPKQDTVRLVELAHPVPLQPGVTQLTERLILICQPALTKIASMVYNGGVLVQQTIKGETEYEAMVAFDPGSSVSTFVTCMHSSFFNMIKSAREHFGKEVTTCHGACHEANQVIQDARQLCPSLRCYFRDFIMDSQLSDYAEAFADDEVTSMRPGDQFTL